MLLVVGLFQAFWRSLLTLVLGLKQRIRLDNSDDSWQKRKTGSASGLASGLRAVGLRGQDSHTIIVPYEKLPSAARAGHDGKKVQKFHYPPLTRNEIPLPHPRGRHSCR